MQINKGMIKDWFGIYSGYSLALEAWRRGLTVTIDDGICSSFTVSMPADYISGQEPRAMAFKNTRPVNAASDEADIICKNKELTKEYLAKEGIIVPEGRCFGKETPDEAIVRYAVKLGFPVVLKPADGEKGKGVAVDLKDENELLRSLGYVRKELGYEKVILERYIPGYECRVLVIGDKVVGALRRIPANITGNGRNTIQQLVAAKNKNRKKNPCTSGSLIKLDRQIIDKLEKTGYSVDSIPADGERLYLRDNSNVSSGGDPVDVTDEIPEAVKLNAIKAVKAIPGLYHGGVDVIIDSDKGTEDSGVIIEINSRPMISLHLFPVEGLPRDAASAIVDLHFPETEAYKEKRKLDNMYFDRSVLEPIIRGTASSVTLRSVPVRGMVFRQLLLKAAGMEGEAEAWAAKLAARLMLSGRTEALEGGRLKVLIGGCADAVEKFINACRNEQQKGNMMVVSVRESKALMYLGFYRGKGEQHRKI